MAKPKMQHISEPDANEIHFEADPFSGNVTLCGLTDFIGATQGSRTSLPVTCRACKSIRKWCSMHVMEKDGHD